LEYVESVLEYVEFVLEYVEGCEHKLYTMPINVNSSPHSNTTSIHTLSLSHIVRRGEVKAHSVPHVLSEG
jgi:hypothetical protein